MQLPDPNLEEQEESALEGLIVRSGGGDILALDATDLTDAQIEEIEGVVTEETLDEFIATKQEEFRKENTLPVIELTPSRVKEKVLSTNVVESGGFTFKLG